MWRPGNGQYPFGEEEILPYLTSAITDDSSPLRGTKVAIF